MPMPLVWSISQLHVAMPLVWSISLGMWMSNEDDDAAPVICNPNTGQYAILPKPKVLYIKTYNILGFDPIDKKYKVLLLQGYQSRFGIYRILTLGTGTMTWRNIKCPLSHSLYCPREEPGICINGVLYYLAEDFQMSLLIVCFDIRSEKFKFIEVDSFCRNFPKLINYKGKLGGIGWAYVDADGGRRTLKFHMWVLEDMEKQEWSKHAYTMPDNKAFDVSKADVSGVVGVTTTGEIVFSADYRHEKSFYVFYFNPERNTLQVVEIQGFGKYHETFANCSKFKIFVNHIEDLNFIT